jgi:hypothetical protein
MIFLKFLCLKIPNSNYPATTFFLKIATWIRKKATQVSSVVYIRIKLVKLEISKTDLEINIPN